MNHNRNEGAIGVFDSGLGGLSVVKELTRILPAEDIVYFGDTGRVPYGTRSRETIERYARQDMAFLLSKQVKMIIAACGTVSSVAAHTAKGLSVPFTEVVTPAAAEAACQTKNKTIGVIGTTATIRSGAYRCALGALGDFKVIEQDCPLFVPLVENGWIGADDEVAMGITKRYLKPILDAGADTLILGCTHYPLLAPIIDRCLGGGVTLVDTGKQAAQQAAEQLARQGLLAPACKTGVSRFYVSDRPEGFLSVASMFLGRDGGLDVERVKIEDVVI